jgi:glycosyltransferase involved in cell wall biosynthesis
MRPRYDILVWANIRPEKHGSFEDFMIVLNRRVNRAGRSILFAFARGVSNAMAALFEKEGLKYRQFSESELHSGSTIYRAVRNHDCRVVHVHFIPILSPLYHAAWLAGAVRVLYTAHSSVSEVDFGRPASFLRQRLRVAATAPVDTMIAVSSFIGKYLTDALGLDPGKTQIVHNGVDLERFRPPTPAEKTLAKARIFSVNDRTPVISFVAQLNAEKGFLDAIHARDVVASTRPEALFAFVGEGAQERSLSGSRNNTVFLGRRDDVESVLIASDVFIAPSTWHEAFGLSIAEAAATGLPAVASDRGGIPEVVVNGVTGFTFRAHDVGALVDRIRWLLDDDALRERLGSKARWHAEEAFDLNTAVAKHMDLYGCA